MDHDFPELLGRISSLELGPPVGWPVQYRIAGRDADLVQHYGHRLAATIGFGVLGYIFNKCKMPHSPLILAVVLGSMMERGLYQSLTLSHGSLAIFVERPISFVLILAALFFIFSPLVKSFYKKHKMRQREL